MGCSGQAPYTKQAERLLIMCYLRNAPDAKIRM
jgi:hypothetical protein